MGKAMREGNKVNRCFPNYGKRTYGGREIISMGLWQKKILKIVSVF
jgi:hypothetical protein